MKVEKTDQEWKKELTSEQYRVLRKEGTEPPFHGPYHDNKEKGVYYCAGCGKKLFLSEDKYDSGSGWPSFTKPVKGSVKEEEDRSFFMKRTKVTCPDCGGHIGHVFKDGPKPTGLRYCLNGTALKFKKK